MHRKGRPACPAKREAILEAAVQAFLEYGYAAASIEAIAADAGVSKVTIYKQFGDKKALFAAAIAAYCAHIREQLLFDEGMGPLPDRLAEFARSLIAFLTRPEIRRFKDRLAAEAQRDPELGVCFLEAGPRRMQRALADLIERASSRGEISVSDPTIAAEHFAGMVKGMAELDQDFAGPVDADATERRISSAVGLFMRGYGRRTGISTVPSKP